MAPALAAAGFHVTVLCGRDADRTRARAAMLGACALFAPRMRRRGHSCSVCRGTFAGIPHACTDAEAAVKRDDVDLVVITSPPRTHAPLTVAALRAGKHVLCEKPMCVDKTERAAVTEALASCPGSIALLDLELRYADPVAMHVAALLNLPFCGGLAPAGSFPSCIP